MKKIPCKTKVTLPGTAWKGVTMNLKALPVTAIAQARRLAKIELDRAKACVEAHDDAFRVETVVPHNGRFRLVKTLQEGDPSTRRLKVFCVMLSYPDTIYDWRESSFTTHVYAADPQDAVAQARKLAILHTEHEGDPEDFGVITVFSGKRGPELNPEI